MELLDDKQDGNLQDPRYRYRYTKGYRPINFNLHTAKAFRRVVLVESALDCLLAAQNGLGNFIASATSNYSLDSLMALPKLGITEVVAASDQDRAGATMTRIGEARSVKAVIKPCFKCNRAHLLFRLTRRLWKRCIET